VEQKDNQSSILSSLKKEIHYYEGTRRISEAKFSAVKRDKTEVVWSLKPKYHIYMCGLGYMHLNGDMECIMVNKNLFTTL